MSAEQASGEACSVDADDAEQTTTARVDRDSDAAGPEHRGLFDRKLEICGELNEFVLRDTAAECCDDNVECAIAKQLDGPPDEHHDTGG